MKTPNYVFDDELYHHGILGQRWGHRRFQNEDGSWTPEGRERYGEGDGPRQAAKPKVDARAKARARASFEEKKYKMYMKSKEQRLKDKIAAKEERNRVREAAKTEKLARKEQAKIDKRMAVLKGTELGKTKNMSDDDLQTAINRLKLEVEYNKNYAIASKPNSALARADRFFEGPTGQVVKAVAVATIPKVAEQFVSKTLESNLKYANKLDRDKQIADIKKQKADAAKVEAEAKDQIQSTKNNRLKNENDIRLNNEKAAQEKLNSDREFEQQKRRDENEYKLNKFDRELEYKKASAQSHRDDLKIEGEQKRLDELQKAEQTRLDNKAKLDEEVRRAEEFGYDPGSRLIRSPNYIDGRLAWKYGSNGSVAQEQETNKKLNSEKVAYEQAKTEALRSKTERENAEAELGRRLIEGTFNGVANLVSQGKSEEAREFQEISSKIKIGSFSGSAEIKSKFDNVISKETTSKPISSLALPSSTNVSESRIESLRSSGMTLREIAEKEHVSTSTIANILYGKKKR